MTLQPRRPAGAFRDGAHPAGASNRPHVAQFAITPFRVVLVVAFLLALVYIAWAILKVDDSAQIPMVTSGIGALGIVFAATSAGSAVRLWQCWKDGLQSQTVVWAIVGGVAGMIALGCFAGTLVLSLVWGA
ncbi:MAG: hypothetical protein EPO00_01930 [Chloroflexota bacterium]|nr:MAG: hypothetical protein EPO00_01930 [Chloroflexota bacterium]